MDGADLIERLPTHKATLDNGLTVLVREDPTAPVAAIVTYVKAGYFHEPDDRVGISHVLEHMYFKGTERRGPGDIARETKAAGGYLNAGTIYDHTSYYTVLPADALEQGLDIQADALQNPKVDADELDRELQVIIQEVKRKLDDPSALASESLYALLFDVHRMRRWRMGTEDQLRGYTRDDVLAFYRRHYRPDNIVLCVVGDVRAADVLRLVDAHYGGMPSRPAGTEPFPQEPDRAPLPRLRAMTGDIGQMRLELGWRTPGTLHHDTPALDLLATTLGQGRGSRCFRQIREPGHVNAVGAYNYTPLDIGVFGISAELEPERADDALAAIARAVRDISARPVEPVELERARSVLETRVLRRLETAEGQASLLAEWEAMGDWRLASRYMDRVGAATPDTLQSVAEQYLVWSGTAVVAYRPEAAPGQDWTADTILKEPNGRPAAAPGAPATPLRDALAAGAPADGAADFTRDGVEDDVHFYSLGNGVRVVVLPRATSPLVTMAVGRRGGVVEEQGDTQALTGMMMRTSAKGTPSRDAAAIALATEMLGGAISSTVSSDLFAWKLTVPGRHFENGFDLLADVALEAAFPEEEVERERAVAIAELARLRDDMARMPIRIVMEGAFQGHPYGVSIQETEAALHAVDADRLRAWHRDRVRGGAPLVIVAGDLAPDRAANVAARAFANLPPAPHADVPPSPVWPLESRRRVQERDRAQTALALGFPAPARNHPDVFALLVTANAISGLGNRLFEELRSRRSLAYSVNAYPIVRWLAGTFVAYIATSPEREDEARQALLEQLSGLVADGIGEDELARAKRYTIGTWRIQRQTNAAVLMEMAEAILLGRGIPEIREFEERVQQVRLHDVRRVVAQYLDEARAVEGVVRGAAAAAN
jgi:zinc protease